MVSTFGTTYYLAPPPDSPNAWRSRPQAHWTDALTGRHNEVLFCEPQVHLGAELRQLWDANGDGAVLAWFHRIPNTVTAAF
jgi:hypothetical protein